MKFDIGLCFINFHSTYVHIYHGPHLCSCERIVEFQYLEFQGLKCSRTKIIYIISAVLQICHRILNASLSFGYTRYMYTVYIMEEGSYIVQCKHAIKKSQYDWNILFRNIYIKTKNRKIELEVSSIH